MNLESRISCYLRPEAEVDLRSSLMIIQNEDGPML